MTLIGLNSHVVFQVPFHRKQLRNPVWRLPVARDRPLDVSDHILPTLLNERRVFALEIKHLSRGGLHV